MTLSDLKIYLSERKMVPPLSDIAVHFDSDPDALRGMLEHWIRKGRVRFIRMMVAREVVVRMLIARE